MEILLVLSGQSLTDIIFDTEEEYAMPYVIKISGGKLGTSANIYKKYWSDELFSNQVNLISSKDFLFKFRAKKWAQKEVINILVNEKEMEIIDGRS